MDINQTTLIGTVVDPPKINSFDGRDGKPRRVGNITVLTEIARGEYTTKTFHRVTAARGPTPIPLVLNGRSPMPGAAIREALPARGLMSRTLRRAGRSTRKRMVSG